MFSEIITYLKTCDKFWKTRNFLFAHYFLSIQVKWAEASHAPNFKNWR